MKQELPMDKDLSLLLNKVHQHTGFDFREYKMTSIDRRIARRLQATSSDSYLKYLEYLNTHPAEYDFLLNDLLINTTGFFRDKEVFESLEEELIPDMIKRKRKSLDENIRIWCVGCSSGQEVYSFSILLHEALKDMEQLKITIYGTDIDKQALSQARKAIYSSQEVLDIPKTYLHTYFDDNQGHFRVNSKIRQWVKFGIHNIVSDAPIAKLDMLFCRNVLIYFSRPLQDKIFKSFHYALNPEGFLVLGKSESPMGHVKGLFKEVNRELRIFQK